MKKNFFLEKTKAIVATKDTHKLIIELGGEHGDEYQRAQQAKNVLQQSMRCLFDGNPIYMAMISWGTSIVFRKQLIECQIPTKVMTDWIKGEDKDGIFDYQLFKPNIVYYSYHISMNDALKIGKGIINNELGIEPYIHANVYFMDLNDQMFLVNLFDDRYFELIYQAEYGDYLIKKLTQEGIVFL